MIGQLSRPSGQRRPGSMPCAQRGQIPMSLLSSGGVTQRSRKLTCPFSLTSFAASRKLVIAARYSEVARLMPAPKRKQATSWKDFIGAHMAVLVATDFFTVEVLTLTGLITYYVLFFIHLESRRICLAGVTRHPDQEWMEQMARNVTMEDSGFLINRRYLLHDRDSKYCSSFGQVIEAGSVKTLGLPPRSPNLNAYAERWVRSVKEGCLSELILLGECSLRSALRHYEAHYHEERNHQGKNNVLLFPLPAQAVRGEREKVRCRERLGVLKYYEREAA